MALIAVGLGLLSVSGVGPFGIAPPETPVAAAHGIRLNDAGLAQISDAGQSPAASVMRARDTVGLTTAPGLIVIRSIERSAHDAIRHGALALLLIGLLAIGSQLLRALTQRLEIAALIHDRPILASVSLGTLAVFFLTTLSLAISPGMLARLPGAAEVEQVAYDCQNLGTNRDRLASVQPVDNGDAIEAAKRRMQRVAADCLGLPHVAVVSAMEQSIERSASVKTEVAMPTAPSAADFTHASEPNSAVDPIAAEAERSRTDRAILRELLASLPPRTKKPLDPSAPAALDQSAALVADDATTAPLEPEPRRLVTRTAVNYRAAPGVQSRRLGTLVSGAHIDVLRQDAGWAEVLLSDGRQVFVASEFLAPVP